MIIGRSWKGNKNRRLAGSCNFGYRARSRPAHQQIGARKGGGHIFNKFENFGELDAIRSERSVSILRVIIVTLTGLMDDVNIRRLSSQFGQAANHGMVDRVRSLAAAENQYCRRSAEFCRNLKKRLP